MSTIPTTEINTQALPTSRRKQRLLLLSASGIIVVLAVISVQLFLRQQNALRQLEASRRFARDASVIVANPPLNLGYYNNSAPPIYTTSPYNVPLNGSPINSSPANSSNLPSTPQTMPLLSSNSQDPIEVNLTAQINQFRKQYLAATADQEKEGLRKSLKAAVDKLFDLRHAAHAKQVDKLDSELKQAKELLKKRSDRKDEIVERRIAELLETPDDLAWNPEPAGLATSPAVRGNTPGPTGSLYVPNLQNNPNNIAPQLNPQANGLSGTFSPLSPSAGSQPSLSTEALQPPQLQEPNLPADSTRSPNGDLTAGPVNLLQNQPDNNNLNFGVSQLVIQTGYNLKAALQEFKRAKSLYERGLINGATFAETQNLANKTEALWRDLEKRLVDALIQSQRELQFQNELQHEEPASRAEQIKIKREILRLESELESIMDVRSWMADFQSESIDPLTEPEQPPAKKDDSESETKSTEEESKSSEAPATDKPTESDSNQ